MGKTFPFLIKLVTGKTTEDLFQPLSCVKQSKQGCGRRKSPGPGTSSGGRRLTSGPCLRTQGCECHLTSSREDVVAEHGQSDVSVCDPSASERCVRIAEQSRERSGWT